MGVPLNIDWQQILLHLSNFIILAGGLYLLLYKPVKAFMVNRQKHYQDLEDEAQKKLKDADNLEKQFSQKLKTAETEISKMRSRASEEASAAAREQLENAKEIRAAIIKKAEKDAETEKQKILSEANKEIEKVISETVDKFLVPSGKNALDDFLDRAESEE